MGLIGCTKTVEDADETPSPEGSIATIAGGCFWCMEPAFQETEGVLDVIVGFSGGDEVNPSYQEVVQGYTGHKESAQIIYDADVISYEQLLEIFWQQIDPTDIGGQFSDRGDHYATAIFYHTDEQQAIAEASKSELEASEKFSTPIVTEILPYMSFYPAEEYHQDFYQKSSDHYQKYSKGSGRKDFIEETWEGEISTRTNTQGYQEYTPEIRKKADQKHIVLFFHADWCSTCQAFEETILSEEIPENILILKVDYDTEDDLRIQYNIVTQTSFVLVDTDGALLKRWIGGRDIASIQEKISEFEQDTSKVSRTYTEQELRERLTPLQYRVTQEGGTEPPFDNLYWDNHEEGIYVDIIDGTPLFSSTDKFDSGTGWPAFTRPIDENFLTEEDDYTLLQKRTEIKSDSSHLGHVFEDGPSEEGGLRYCINSAALLFVAKDDMEDQGHSEYLFLFE